jgi:GrpB-like predicted nucleotidyltransferase (UPF0157 family)
MRRASDRSRTDPILIVAYDATWPIAFEKLRGCLLAALGEVAVTIEHVGSTAVLGLAAKAILDVDVVVRSASDAGEAIRRLGEFGYQHLGDQGIRGREAFNRPPDTAPHHLYVVVQGSEPLRNHIQFRDYLRAHPEKAKEYQRLKQTLAAHFRDDRDGYTEAKTEFVRVALRQECAILKT